MENKNEAIDFEKEEQRLDEILEKLDNKGLKLDESVKLYKEGTEIVKKREQCSVIPSRSLYVIIRPRQMRGEKDDRHQ